MINFAIKHPTAILARGIENLVITGENSKNFAIKVGCSIFSRAISVTVLPIFISLELFFKRTPKALYSFLFSTEKNANGMTKFERNVDKIAKFVLCFVFSPFGLISADAISGFFLKRSPTISDILPFGVEDVYGKTANSIQYPKTTEELQKIIRDADQENLQVSIIGSGMSQGTQTVPENDKKNVVIHTKFINQIEIDEKNNIMKVGSGATWEQVQIELNQKGKSAIVKQASDPFSIGGSIGINCHGWAHEYGAISSVVNSMRIIDAKGDLITLTPKDELFGCMFGTLGWFGIIVDVEFKIRDNIHVVEKSERVELDDFDKIYKEKIKGKNIPLFGGRLCLDSLEGNPLRYVEMNHFEKDTTASTLQGETPLVTPYFTPEYKYGTRVQRIGLQAISHFSSFITHRLSSHFWKGEIENMHQEKKLTLNEALHPPIQAFKMLHHSKLHAQWLQEYFITPKNLPNFLRYLGAELKANDVKLINATIRPTPQDKVSILPYAEQDRYAVVLCFEQTKSQDKIAHTKQWIENVNKQVISQGDVYYQAYMPYATQEQFETCYGKERIQKMRSMKQKYDRTNRFGNAHTAKYFEKKFNLMKGIL
jgi:UDP-N-acetylenolpyruvoylglucosamine reductase